MYCESDEDFEGEKTELWGRKSGTRSHPGLVGGSPGRASSGGDMRAEAEIAARSPPGEGRERRVSKRQHPATCEISRLEEQKCGGPAAVCLAERARERGGGEGRKGDRFGHEAPVSQTHPGTGPGPAHLSQQPGGLVGTLAGQVGTWGLTLPSDS